MTQRTVFICYSHRDQAYFKQLLTLLAPLKERGQLHVWTDVELRKGTNWRERIFREIDQADASIALVSQHLLASDFVRESELPRLIEAQELRGLKLVPLWVRHCLHDWVGFTVETNNGSQQIFLDEIQGLNSPEKPLADFKKPAREALLTSAVKTFLKELLEEPAVRALRQKARRDLAVKLELGRDSTQLIRRFGEAPGFNLYTSLAPIKLPALLEAAQLDPSDHGLGHELFELLLGSDQERNKLLTLASGHDAPDPLLRTFRVRVWSSEHKLRALPWAACRWRQSLLAEMGWTFELAPDEEAPRSLELDTPCKSLAILGEPENAPALSTATHARAFENLLRQAWQSPLKPKLLRIARIPAQAKAELENKPHFVHLYTHARSGRHGLEVLLEDSRQRKRWTAFANLAQQMQQWSPRVLLLNTVGECPLVEPIPSIDVILHLRHRTSDWTARTVAVTWWNDVLGERIDPVRAFYRLDSGVRHRGAIYARFQNWNLEHSDYTSKVDRPRAHLDRRDQRRVVREAVSDLVNIPGRQITCLVAYGSEGNLVEDFAMQVLSTMKEQPPPPRGQYGAKLVHKKLPLPGERETLTRDLILDNFRENLELQAEQPLSVAFAQRHRAGPRTRPVYFLDWGTYGANHQPEILSGHLASWIEFCCHDLKDVCPPLARIVAYISLVSPKARHGQSADLLSKLQQIYLREYFELIEVPPLPPVRPEDLLRFLSNEHNSSCPPALHQDLSERIVLETGGRFQNVVELLEDAERGPLWDLLDERLPRAPTESELPKDIPL